MLLLRGMITREHHRDVQRDGRTRRARHEWHEAHSRSRVRARHAERAVSGVRDWRRPLLAWGAGL